MKTLSLQSKVKSAFTLMELLIVLVILIVIIALMVPNITKMWDSANRKATSAQIGKFETALKQYHMDTGMYPTTAQGLQALLTRPEMDNSMGNMSTPGTPTPDSGLMPPSNNGLGFDNNPMNPDSNSPFNPSGTPSPWSPTPPTPTPNPPSTQPGGWAPQGPTGMDGPGTFQPPMDISNPQQSQWGGDQSINGPATFGGDMAGPASLSDMGPASSLGGQPNQPGYGQPTGSNSSNMMMKMVNALKKWDGPYLEEVSTIPLDIWNNEFHYEWPTDKTTDGRPAIWSTGKDETDPTWRIANFDEAETQSVKAEREKERQYRLQQYNQGRTGQQGTGGINGNDPLGGSQIPNSDPFGGGGNQIPNSDPFGGGGSQIPNSDPFGGGGNQIPNSDPFGGGGNPQPTPPQPTNPW